VAKAVKVANQPTGDADIDYMTALGLMKGHLIVAKELMAQGNYKQAEPPSGIQWKNYMPWKVNSHNGKCLSLNPH